MRYARSVRNGWLNGSVNATAKGLRNFGEGADGLAFIQETLATGRISLLLLENAGDGEQVFLRYRGSVLRTDFGAFR